MENEKMIAAARAFLRQGTRVALDILFPPICAHCEADNSTSTTPLCADCTRSIAKNTALICPVCAVRMAHNKRICNHGQRDRAQFPYLLGAATTYDDPIIRACIHRCKYEKVHALADVFSTLLVDYVRALNPQPGILATTPTVVPIPLHMRKERERGFNQSALIAHSFADAMQLPYDELLVKITDNDPQAQEKTHTARFENIRGAFAIPRPHAVQNKNIILIDDVSTSGATLSEAAQTLKAAGARQILALVVAKA